ncbi:hypothetical protein QII55_gp3 [ssRNA phage SRR7976326_2]|uniref:Uncharacterized protein n=1 Tax=ssRNA phage SRR7976326_2 TaxID=2786726 RepID=A0A8S5KZT5_9VIRU|nr:hypothetical protein QII55_gp3 [ssRNA phage SRR7976326_2]DAD51214.1 TPA_asm: hypothetical protein [ssRNA phage SRR7976326_2]
MGPQALSVHIAWIVFCLLALSPGPVLLAVLKRLLELLGA